MEVTKCLKPPDSGHEFGDCASVQAATRVNAEQTSRKRVGKVTLGRFVEHPVRLMVSVSATLKTNGLA